MQTAVSIKRKRHALVSVAGTLLAVASAAVVPKRVEADDETELSDEMEVVILA